MRRSSYLIISGVAMLAAGAAVGAIGILPILQKLAEQSQVLTNEPIQSGATKALTLDVSDTSRQISAVISSSTDSNVPLRAVLKGPDASIIADSTFRSNTVLMTKPTTTGLYALLITNNGDASTNLNVIFGYLPAAGQSGENMQLFAVPIAGGIIFLIGIATTVIGIAVAIVDRKSKTLPSSTAA